MLQQDLAEHLKVAKSTVSGWEVGRNQPDYDTLIELSIFFGKSDRSHVVLWAKELP